MLLSNLGVEHAGVTSFQTAQRIQPSCHSTGSVMVAANTGGKEKSRSTSKGKLNPNKSPPLPDHLKDGIQIEECETPVIPEHFIIVDNLRYVLPYHFDFKLHAKKRMVGVPIVDLFASEFPVRPRCDAVLALQACPSRFQDLILQYQTPALVNINPKLTHRWHKAVIRMIV